MSSKVYSPYYPENGYVNPNFPFGCSRSLNAKIQTLQQPVRAKGEVIIAKRPEDEVKAIKIAQKECVNKTRLTTIFKRSCN